MFDTGKYGKLFLFTLGTSLLLVGFLGVMVDLSDFKITEFGNFLIMTMGIGVLILVGIFYRLVPAWMEQQRKARLYEHYARAPNGASMGALHDCTEAAQAAVLHIDLALECCRMGGDGHDALDQLDQAQAHLVDLREKIRKL
jgi:hypothetical protein